ncbi:MAG: cupredoxin domain-containing protein [Chloroflexi bacterium]|nr:cupredoxin domain-containing protein [Chloroflexota bacterium]
MFKKTIAVTVLTAFMLLLVAACGGGAKEEATPKPAATKAPATTAETMMPAAGAVEVLLADKNNVYIFKPDTFTFKVGQKVSLVLKSEGQFHTFTANDLTTTEGKKVDAQVLAGATANLEFTPSKAGTYKLTCLPHEALGMVGTIKVE